MANRFKFPIFPDRMYTLQYEQFSTEVSGEEILAAFRRDAYLSKLIADLDDTDIDNPSHWGLTLDSYDGIP